MSTEPAQPEDPQPESPEPAETPPPVGSEQELAELAPDQDIHTPPGAPSPDLTVAAAPSDIPPPPAPSDIPPPPAPSDIPPPPAPSDIPPPPTTQTPPPVFAPDETAVRERPAAIPTPAAPAVVREEVESPLLAPAAEERARSDSLARALAGGALALALCALLAVLMGMGPAKEPGPDSVGSEQLRAGAVSAEDVAPETLESLQGKRGPAGEPGARGPRGERGPRGARGAAAPTPQITTESSDVRGITASFASSTASCPASSTAVGGGGVVTDAQGAVQPATLSASEPLPDRSGWRVEARKPLDTSSSAAPWSLRSWVVCVSESESQSGSESSANRGE